MHISAVNRPWTAESSVDIVGLLAKLMDRLVPTAWCRDLRCGIMNLARQGFRRSDGAGEKGEPWAKLERLTGVKVK
jgi:hypothetical protein